MGNPWATQGGGFAWTPSRKPASSTATSAGRHEPATATVALVTVRKTRSRFALPATR